MNYYELIIKSAKSCHTKYAWEKLIDDYSIQISTTNNSKFLADLFKLVRSDPDTLKYSPIIFGTLIKGCLSSWNLELGHLIFGFASKITAPEFTIPAAQLYLERGEPNTCRQIIQKSLRLSTISRKSRLQLQMLLCNSYAEDGKSKKANAIIEKIKPETSDPSLCPQDRANFKVQMARMLFFLGNYSQASVFFNEAAPLYIKVKDWEGAAKAHFNTAACLQNAGDLPSNLAFQHVEQSKKLAVKHNLKGPMSHCEAFYGLDAYQHGSFTAAKTHFRQALDYLPQSDKSYRRLHIISMLSICYFSLRQFNLAKKYGIQTLKLAKLDKSNRNSSRYHALNAELFWEQGNIDESQCLLQKEIECLEGVGVKTLEELSTYNRYIYQHANLYPAQNLISLKISPNLKNQSFTYRQYQLNKGLYKLNRGQQSLAAKQFGQVLSSSTKHHDSYHKLLATIGQIQCSLSLNDISSELLKKINQLDSMTNDHNDRSLKALMCIIKAGYEYQKGNFSLVTEHLRQATRTPRINYTESFAAHCWLATIEGRSFRLKNNWQANLIAAYTRTYFAPRLETTDFETFIISNNYTVDLKRTPLLAQMLNFLCHRYKFSSDLSNLQLKVWKQSLNSTGWQQKIRNSIMRIRDLFPYTMAPLILHNENISLFADAINISLPKHNNQSRDDQITTLLMENDKMTSAELTRQLSLSPATIKRYLHQLVSENKIAKERLGRNIYYGISKD